MIPLYVVILLGNLFTKVYGITNLTILALLNHSGREGLGMTGCNEAIDIVLQHVNQRQDILPTFHLTHQAANEGLAAREANRKIIDFERSFENDKSVVRAPVSLDQVGLVTFLD